MIDPPTWDEALPTLASLLHRPDRPMQEEAYNRVRADNYGSFTFTSKRSLEAFLRRADEYDIETDVNRYYIDGDFDTATVKVPAGSLRPLRYLLSTA